MPQHQSALPEPGAGLTCVLELLGQMMRALEERLAPPPPPPGVLARLVRLVSGRALADQARRAVCAMLRAKLALLASSLASSVTADPQSHATAGEPAQDAAERPGPQTKPVAPRAQDIAALETGAPPLPCARGGDGARASIADAQAAPAIMWHAACATLDGDAAALPGSGAGRGSGAGVDAPMCDASPADDAVPCTSDEDAPGLDLEAVVTGAARAGDRIDVNEGSRQAQATAVWVRATICPELARDRCVAEHADGGQAARAPAHFAASLEGVVQRFTAPVRRPSVAAWCAKRDRLSNGKVVGVAGGGLSTSGGCARRGASRSRAGFVLVGAAPAACHQPASQPRCC